MDLFIIGLREGIEAFLVIFLVLRAIQLKKDKFFLILGAIFGIIFSVIFAILLEYFKITFTNIEKQISIIIEVTLVFVFTYNILFFSNEKKTNEEKIKNSLFILSFTMVIREGIEVSLFTLKQNTEFWWNSILGIILSIIICLLVVNFKKNISLKLVFKITNIYLILICGYLFGHIFKTLIEIDFIKINDFIFIDLSNTILNTKKSVIGYIIHILTGVYYKYYISQFIAQLLFVCGIFTWLHVKRNKLKNGN